MRFLTHGKRGDIYLTTYKGKMVVVKRQRRDSKAIHRIANEVFWLKKLNTYGIGPRFIKFTKGKLMMEYVRGTTIGEYVKKKFLSKTLAREVLQQCRILDNLKVNKLEMQHPVKHILIKKGPISRKTVVMIDFERCKQTEKPKNVTQFCQYLLKLEPFRRKKIKNMLQKYKQTYSEKDFQALLAALFLI